MKLRNILAASAASFALFAATPAFADGHADAAAETPLPTGSEGPALFKVADEDTTIYLFGTVHTLPADIDWRTGPVDTAIANSETLVTEIDLTPEKMAGVAAAMQAKGTLPAGETLRGLMNEDQRATFEAGLAEVGIPAEALDPLEPWLASVALIQFLSQRAGFSRDRGVENVLEGIFPEGTERVALEDVDFQISVFDETPVDQQITFLLSGAEDPLESLAALNSIVELWSTGRLDELGDLMREGFEPLPELGERMIYSRNASWAEWIDARLDDPGTVFMAVGALHLSGERNVPDLLAEQGVEVKRIQ